ncbi:DUF3100 domain-containing protein [Psychromicrobium xiongbiense]|uniref:DUF3100 domain-containing protein n=1 Tax=Psychromicrobium xiongbiense TaxID=3051184 RepID=UPI002556A7A7|nr:DUF3100 domain-containing protein [Psychromicrobium sp. YIM S02556]
MTASTLRSDAPRTRVSLKWLWPLGALALVLASLSQFIGPAVIPLGIASITLLPMVWGILAGGIISGQRFRPFPVRLQSAAGSIMGIAVLVLVASLAFTIGPNVPLLFKAGPALLLQEVGHMLGTLVLALPLAVVLRMGPATIGATFSIDREGSFAIVSDKYGPESDQYRGVLSMYLFGTLFGALFISVLASLMTSFKVFDPLALAMGAGVGSSSMMAAGAASVASQYPGMKDQIFAVAAASNVVTGPIGVYVAVWIALPLADKIYHGMTSRFPALAGKDGQDLAPALTAGSIAAEVKSVLNVTKVPLTISMPALTVIGIIISAIAAKSFSWNMVWGYLIIDALILASIGLSRLCRGKVISMVFIITLGTLLSSPISPIASFLVSMVTSVNFLSITTVVLTFAGLSLGKDLPLLRRVGWRIIPVGLVAIASSYLFSTFIAELILRNWK